MNRQLRSETELGPVKTNSDTVNGNDEGKRKEPLNLKKWLKAFITSITVEPYLVLYFFAIHCTSIANKNFYLEKACRADLNQTEDVCLDVIAGSNDTIVEEVTKNASILVAELSAWKDPAQLGIPAIYVLFIGAWSDRTGNRNAVLILPMIGEFLTLVGSMLSVYNMTEWPLWVMGFVEVVCAGFTGGFTIALTGSYYYLADITSDENRTFRIGIFVFIVKVSSLIIIPIAGVLTNALSYIGLYAISMALYIVGLTYVFLRIRNVKKDETTGTFWYKLGLFFNPRNVVDTFAILYKSRGIRLVQIILIILVQVVIFGPNTGEGSIVFLYTKNVYKMNIVDYALYQTWSNVLSTFGIAIAVTLFSKWLRFHDAAIGLICTVSNVLSSITCSLAPNLTWFYVGAAMDVFGGAAGAPLKSLGTKFVGQNDMGKICSLMGLIDSLIPVMFVPIFNKVLSKSLADGLYIGTVYILGAALTAPAFVILGVLYFFHKRQQRNVVQNPDTKEVHVYENDITTL